MVFDQANLRQSSHEIFTGSSLYCDLTAHGNKTATLIAVMLIIKQRSKTIRPDSSLYVFRFHVTAFFHESLHENTAHHSR